MKLGRTLIDTATLEEGVARLASEIDRDQAGRPALLVGILKGSIFSRCPPTALARNPPETSGSSET